MQRIDAEDFSSLTGTVSFEVDAHHLCCSKTGKLLAKPVAASCGHLFESGSMQIGEICQKCEVPVTTLSQELIFWKKCLFKVDSKYNAVVTVALSDLSDIIIPGIFYNPVAMPCGHISEQENLEAACRHNPTCPECRANVTSVSQPILAIQHITRMLCIFFPDLTKFVFCSPTLIAKKYKENGLDEHFKLIIAVNRLHKTLAAEMIKVIKTNYQNDYLAAQKECVEVLTWDPENIEALLLLAIIFNTLGDYTQAVNMTERAHALEPQSVIVQGKILAELGYARLMLGLQNGTSFIDSALGMGCVPSVIQQQFGSLGDHPLTREEEETLKKCPFPCAGRFLLALGIILFKKQKFDIAANYCRSAHSQLNNDISWFWVQLSFEFSNVQMRKIADKMLMDFRNMPSCLIAICETALNNQIIMNIDLILENISVLIDQLPKSEVLLITRATYYLENEDYVRVLEDVNNLLEFNPDNDQAMIMRSVAKYNSDDINGALSDLVMLIERFSDNANIRSMLSQAYMRKGQYSDAIREANLLVSQHASNSESFVTRGLIYFDNQEYESALVDFKTALMLDPQSNLAKRFLIRAYVELNQENDAFELLMPMIEAMEKGDIESDANFYQILYHIYLKHRDHVHALAAMNKAITIDPNNLQIYAARLDVMLSVAEMNDAAPVNAETLSQIESDLTFCITHDPMNFTLNYQAARLCKLKNDNDKGIEICGTLIDQDPLFIRLYKLRGAMYLNKKNFVAALQDFNFVLSYRPTSYRGLYGHMRAAMGLEDFACALGSVTTLLEMYPDDVNLKKYKETIDLKLAAKHLVSVGIYAGAKEDSSREPDPKSNYQFS